ncbi:MAG: phosphatase PAP2 family protein [Deltaproteobacteria bacterium]|nr:phosphatase PAP2 family protein [Deltaproteobacteria bacterium]
MNASRSLSFFVLFLTLFILNTFFVFQTGFMEDIDRRVYEFLFVFKSAGRLRISHWLTFPGNGATLYVLAGLFILWFVVQRRFGAAIWYFASLAGGFQLNAFLKICFERVRPVGYDPAYLPHTFAYPSGHAFDSFVFYFLTLLIISGKWPGPLRVLTLFLAVLLVLSIGASRITLGVHWLSDVTGGLFLGAAWVFLNLVLVKKLKEKDL